MTVIDLSGQIDDICRRYPKYWLFNEAQSELLVLWGSPDCNDCGVFESTETVRIDLDGTTGTAKSASPSPRMAGMPFRLATGTARAEADQRRQSGTAPPTPRATKPSKPALMNSSPNLKACATAKAARRKISPRSHGRMIKTFKDYLSQARQLTLF